MALNIERTSLYFPINYEIEDKMLVLHFKSTTIFKREHETLLQECLKGGIGGTGGGSTLQPEKEEF